MPAHIFRNRASPRGHPSIRCTRSVETFMRPTRDKAMYHLSARQILSIALLSAVLAAVAVAFYDRWGNRLQTPTGATEGAQPAATAGIDNITDPSVATDERNNIEVFRSVSPGVVSISATTRPRGYFDAGGRGSGSGSV